jgi:hypothetical protein
VFPRARSIGSYSGNARKSKERADFALQVAKSVPQRLKPCPSSRFFADCEAAK